MLAVVLTLSGRETAMEIDDFNNDTDMNTLHVKLDSFLKEEEDKTFETF